MDSLAQKWPKSAGNAANCPYLPREASNKQDQSTLWSLSASNTLKCNAMLSYAKQCNDKQCNAVQCSANAVQ